MKNISEVKSYISQSSGIITSKEFKTNNIEKYYINKLISEGIIERYKKGIYIRTDVFEDEFYILQKKNPSIIFSYNTAMYLLNKTERTPINIDITVYSGFNGHRLPKNIKIHYVKKEDLKLGCIKVKTPFGFEVVTYNNERIICDLIKNKNHGTDKEQANKFIREMFLEKQIDILKLIEYSKLLNCEKKVRTIMEVFI
ncbi:putative transcriptional regulator of viral defense system [Breznakia sp. PF5-3]|uniref:type IV toxin-antitoxin system AbiEi family antitoxin domain-containing protein n=1 Tax=unclassified Breznakia TaxID=2623764 RepID=UPI0024054E8D|nr:MULTISPECIES: type IV toxin-antitoxin system AbiEi family antitoxin domain-containing protein [unclassified Breznakia]MDF9824537.1 putative transcriptional regulator of viral defense system [Breznakia sp. PM6-1]MDF9835323.1 putative transcriptional regulator of viral defense system [Breznakia sp. PF5-3]MDF9837039.1 putative transcriptional regulator of viral defense system [Breznakia sp. PFB2-8]MDF9858964.1 putative transcriptional regulator of viral defense system [Breznakia sp. PH5-24]